MNVKSRLKPRDHAILQGARRYRVLTLGLIWKLYLPQMSFKGATRVVTKLAEAGWLSSHPFPGHPRRRYFTIGPCASRLYGLRRRLTQPLKPWGLALSYAAVLFSTRPETKRIRPTLGELRSQHRMLVPRDLDVHYVIENSPQSGPRIVLIRLDHGGEVGNRLHRLKTDVYVRWQKPAWRKVIESGEFAIALLCANELKAKAFSRAIEEGAWELKQVPLIIEAYPELSPFTFGSVWMSSGEEKGKRDAT